MMLWMVSHAPEHLHDDPAWLRLHTTLKIANSSISWLLKQIESVTPRLAKFNKKFVNHQKSSHQGMFGVTFFLGKG